MKTSQKVAFALVEVVLALGVISFCLVAIMGLMSVGFVGMVDANQQAGGAVVLGQIASNIRTASTNAAGNYQALGSCTNLNWAIGGSPVSANYTNFSLAAYPSSQPDGLCPSIRLCLCRHHSF